jgi:hypothetical protein
MKTVVQIFLLLVCLIAALGTLSAKERHVAYGCAAIAIAAVAAMTTIAVAA